MAIGPAEANEAVRMARSTKVKGAMREIDEGSRNYRQPGRLKVIELQARGRNRKMRKRCTLGGGMCVLFYIDRKQENVSGHGMGQTTRHKQEENKRQIGRRGNLTEVAEFTCCWCVPRWQSTTSHTASRPGLKASTSNMVSRLDFMHVHLPFHTV